MAAENPNLLKQFLRRNVAAQSRGLLSDSNSSFADSESRQTCFPESICRYRSGLDERLGDLARIENGTTLSENETFAGGSESTSD
jgi:hypothetical protein